MAEILYSNHHELSKIIVKVKNGKVILRGAVSSDVSRKVINDIALNIPGVTSVINQIIIEASANSAHSNDDGIKTRIEKLIKWNPDLDGSNISFKIKNGIVSLTGSVDVFWKKQHAKELVSYIKDVVKVINNINIVPTKRIKDEVILESVMDALKRNDLTEDSDISLKVKNGLVTLYGNVKNWATKDAANSAAFYAPVVINLDNRLNIFSK